MPQFALEMQLQVTKGQTLADGLNSVLLQQPSWKVAAIHTVVTKGSGLISGPDADLLMIATVIIDSPEHAMPDIREAADNKISGPQS